MQTLRKKTSPLKYKNETTRFLGDGVSFKAKLIGILEVSEARGDRMCQEALSDLKMAIRAAGEHKQRITINIAIDGLRLRDEKTGDSLYHHPVHKISFIAQDMTDSRAFGYIFGSPDTGHRFFGIKTDKAASQVVIAMRDLFQVVFALKKKEIELAKQHLDKNRFNNSPIFCDSSVSNKLQPVSQEASKSIANETKSSQNSDSKTGGTAVADLVDLELELNSLQQGLNQMERITPSDPFGSKDDPFGDSFTSYTKPILPPPPSSGRERSSRTSDSSSVFSPKTLHNLSSLDSSCGEPSGPRDGKQRKEVFFHEGSQQDSTAEDWLVQSVTKTKTIFEEPALVPEHTKSEKHKMTKEEILSQFDVFTELDPLELKNPPKKVLNDLVSQTQPEQNLFSKNRTAGKAGNTRADFTTDPFGEDPFVAEDPFAETDFAKQDPFESEFSNFKPPKDFESFKIEKKPTDNVTKVLKDSVVGNISPGVHINNKQSVFEVQFDKPNARRDHKLMKLHEKTSLDISSESECAPEPPPRPESTLLQIKPPPLPPKKLGNDLSVKPPPRPPHTEESHYDYMDEYETASNSLEFTKIVEKSPPLPLPARKLKFDSDFSSFPERPKKQFNVQSSEEDYLTPISFPETKIEDKDDAKRPTPGLLPPPQRSIRKQNVAQVTVASYLESKPKLTTSIANDNPSVDSLDITLTQLTLSGLNELATKLHIPANQLSNMTLVQLTNYLSNFVKQKTSNETQAIGALNSETNPTFHADFAANFNNLNSNTTAPKPEPYDRYAVFRELINEEIKQTKIDTEPEQLKEEDSTNGGDDNVNNIYASVEDNNAKDKYAALREIVESELKSGETEVKVDDNVNESERTSVDQDETNILNIENKFVDKEKSNFIEYSTDSLENKNVVAAPVLKSPQKIVKSPVPVAVTEIMHTSARLNSGSLSDVVSGSSPEVDNTASNSEKKAEDAAGESWAIFDQSNVATQKEPQAVQSEEGVSPWSSDSKEFGNGSPSEWRRADSGSDNWTKRHRGNRREQEGWWDTSAEPEVQYYPTHRRSTDSYEDEYYECYERPRRKKQSGYVHGGQGQGQGAGGHSSSSRDVSPWEEEPRRRSGWMKHARQHSFEKHREMRHADSWDDEDDYEYEEEHVPPFHRADRSKRDLERERYSASSREHDGDRWGDEWMDERRHRRRREGDRERWCCPDWDQSEHEKPMNKSGGGRWPNTERLPGMWRDRKYDERYHRESQESPWEDEYSNEGDEIASPHYLTAKRNWKRPSSASEMDRKTGEIKSKHYLGTGGSDGERDRRYKPGRRSRSRDSHYSEFSHRHKSEINSSIRGPHRLKQYTKQFENEFPDKKPMDNSKMDHSNKKSATLTNRKKSKESPKSDVNVVSTFPRKATCRAKSLFENDFVPAEESPDMRIDGKFSFENDMETSEAESPTIANKTLKDLKQQNVLHNEFNKEAYRPRSLKEAKSRLQNKPKSLFEDDFSRGGKADALPEDNSISSIKEEIDPNDKDGAFCVNNFKIATNRKKKFNKHRLSSSLHADVNIKKSESVNIFARESDPFDDDFFCENVASSHDAKLPPRGSPRATDLKWTDDFEDFDSEERK